MPSDYTRIAEAIALVQAHGPGTPSLGDVAAHMGLLHTDCERLIRRWSGMAPHRFLGLLSAYPIQPLLEESSSRAETIPAGFVLEVATDAQARAGLRIAYGMHDSPFGPMLLATTEQGVCGLGFVDGPDAKAQLARLVARWPRAKLAHEPGATAPLAEGLFRPQGQAGEPLRLWVHGTDFQVAVWRTLLGIPSGALISYAQVAAMAGRPDAVRAAAGAVAANPIAFLIPCHRVVRKEGTLGGYAYGVVRKQAMLAWEAAARSAGVAADGVPAATRRSAA
jgi:AraC family transcriptional regulator of adaptative response/methylated-DNA-[protein]-cysteine methyltransferase